MLLETEPKRNKPSCSLVHGSSNQVKIIVLFIFSFLRVYIICAYLNYFASIRRFFPNNMYMYFHVLNNNIKVVLDQETKIQGLDTTLEDNGFFVYAINFLFSTIISLYTGLGLNMNVFCI